MTQTMINPVTTIPALTTPVSPGQLAVAATDWSDVRLPDGRVVYPGAKLSFLIERDGAEAAADYLNRRAADMATPTPLYQMRDVRMAMENLDRLVATEQYAAATEAERDIWAGVLEAVATGNAQAGYLAAAALETQSRAFPRTR